VIEAAGTTTTTRNAYAGFWRRAAALIIDAIILSALLGLVSHFGLPVYDSDWTIVRSGVASWTAYHKTLQGNATGMVIWWLYYAIFESSSRQATIGKMAMSIRVMDLSGARLTFWRASARNWAKIISSLIFLIGFAMAAFTPRKQALHDIITNCVVVKALA
jgi:uncharacterized RDD family membrane protein YckC